MTPERREWTPVICINGKQIRLGTFNDETEAERVIGRANEMKEAGVVDRAQYVALRPTIRRNKKDGLPKGVARDHDNGYSAYTSRGRDPNKGTMVDTG